MSKKEIFKNLDIGRFDKLREKHIVNGLKLLMIDDTLSYCFSESC